MSDRVAALFVEPSGVYSRFAEIVLWPESMDARRYAGTLPVVAHPPCARWSQTAELVASLGGPEPGADGGCFASALYDVERCGGVLEHPRLSKAWPEFSLDRPVRGQWTATRSGWTAEVSQAAYGHRAEKLTWLYVVSDSCPPALDWSVPETDYRVSEARGGTRGKKRMSSREAKATPIAFARLLLRLAMGHVPPMKQLAFFTAD